MKYNVAAILFALLSAGFVGLYSETALNMAFNDFIVLFQIAPSDVQWLTTGYLLTLGIIAPVSGFLLRGYTSRQIFVVSLGLSIAGTLLAALAPGFEVLLVARIVQAAGTGLMLALTFNTVLVIFPPHKRGGAMGIVGLVILFAPAAGPMISGFVLEKLTWQWIFWLSLPILICSLICGLVYLKNTSEPVKQKIDILSVVLSTLGFGGIVYGFSSAGGSPGGWGSLIVVLTLSVGGVSLVLFSIRQFVLKEPMLNLRAFRNPMFAIGMTMVSLGMMIILSSSVLLPMYLQGGLALTALHAGLVLLPGNLLNGTLSPIVGRLFDRFGPKWMVLPGFILSTVMLFLFSNMTPDMPKAAFIGIHAGLMIGISFIMMPSQTNGLNQLPGEMYPDGTAIMNTLQQVSGAIGTSVAVTIMATAQRQAADSNAAAGASDALIAGVHSAFVFGIVIAIVGCGCSLFFRRVKVARTEERSVEVGVN